MVRVAREGRKLWRERERENRVMEDSSTEFSSRSILTLVFPAEPWASWTPSSMISLNELLAKLHDLLTITRERLSLHERSKRQFDYSYLVNSLSTLLARVPKQWRSTLAPSKSVLLTSNGHFNGHTSRKTNYWQSLTITEGSQNTAQDSDFYLQYY